MTGAGATYVLVGCPFDQWRDWYRPDDGEPRPTHECSQGVPQGMTVATLTEHPWPRGRSTGA